jgi:hypothetical protein
MASSTAVVIADGASLERALELEEEVDDWESRL